MSHKHFQVEHNHLCTNTLITLRAPRSTARSSHKCFIVNAISSTKARIKGKVGWNSASRIRIDNKTELAVPDIPLRTEIEARLVYNDDDQRAQGHIIHRSGEFWLIQGRAVTIICFWMPKSIPLGLFLLQSRPSGHYAKFLAR